MNVKEVVQLIETTYPLNLQESWDCGGLQISHDKEVNNIMLTLDITSYNVATAIKNKVDLIITHHPLIFNSYLKTPLYLRILYHQLKQANIALYSMHTNYDNHKYGMNYFFLKELNYLDNIINFTNNIYTFEVNENIISDIKTTFNTDIRIYNQANTITKAAVILGSGGSLLEEVITLECDCLISGEFSHNIINYAKEKKIVLIELYHQIENIFIKDLYHQLNNILKDITITSISDLYTINNY